MEAQYEAAALQQCAYCWPRICFTEGRDAEGYGCCTDCAGKSAPQTLPMYENPYF